MMYEQLISLSTGRKMLKISYDCSNTGMRQADVSIDLCEAHLDEVLLRFCHYAVPVQATFVVGPSTNILVNLVPKNLREKICIMTKEKISEFMDDDIILNFLGGPVQTSLSNISEGVSNFETVGQNYVTKQVNIYKFRQCINFI